MLQSLLDQGPAFYAALSIYFASSALCLFVGIDEGRKRERAAIELEAMIQAAQAEAAQGVTFQ